MWKKVLISLILIIIAVIGIKLIYEDDQKKEIRENIITNEVDLSSQYVTDECVNEWKDYSLTVQEQVKETSQNINDENKTYIVKAEDNYIKVYYLNTKNEKILYKVTDISVQYLEEEDVEKLKQGIEVKGLQELNQLLEDFE